MVTDTYTIRAMILVSDCFGFAVDDSQQDGKVLGWGYTVGIASNEMQHQLKLYPNVI